MVPRLKMLRRKHEGVKATLIVTINKIFVAFLKFSYYIATTQYVHRNNIDLFTLIVECCKFVNEVAI